MTMIGYCRIPNDFKPISYKWVLKTKTDSKGNIKLFRLRLLSKGSFNEKELIVMIYSPLYLEKIPFRKNSCMYKFVLGQI